MSTPAGPVSREAELSVYATGLLAGVLVVAPLYMGGNRPLPLLLLELAALVLIGHLAMRRASWQRLSPALRLLVGGIFVLPLLQLFPLPQALWEILPGRAYYADTLRSAGIVAAYPALSLIPGETEGAWLTLLVPIAVFLATLAVDQRRLHQLVGLFIGLALLQAIIGLAQYGTGWVAVFWPGKETIVRAQGTYANPDHLAGLLEMALPLALALLVAHFQPGRRPVAPASAPRDLRQKVARLLDSGVRFNRVALYGAAALGILLGLIFSRSRTGIALAMLGILLCAVFFSRHLGGRSNNRVVTIFALIGLALAVEIGLAPILAGFSAKALTDPYRWSIYIATLQGIGELLPFGSGFGTYPWAFRRFHPGDVPQFVNHAHNDYLEWLFEGGIPAALILVLGLAIYVSRWRAIWPRDGHWPTYTFLRISAGIGLLLISLHGLVDFNLHIPANAVYFAFIAGIFFHPENPPPPKPPELDRAPKTQPPTPPSQPRPAPVAPAQPQVTANHRNPFADDYVAPSPEPPSAAPDGNIRATKRTKNAGRLIKKK